MNKKDVTLGILFFGSLVGLGIVTIGLSDFAIGVERHDVVMYSDDVGYLRPGDPVLLHGMHSGKVRTIERLSEPVMLPRPGATPGAPNSEVRCTVRIVSQLHTDPFGHLHPDYRVLIEDRGLLGGKLIRIDAGLEDGIIDPESTIVALNDIGVVKAAGAVVGENRANIQSFIEDITQMAEDANAGKGTLGRLIRDGGIADEAEAVLADLKELGRRLTEGEGTFGKLFTDEQMYEDYRVFGADLRSFGDRVKRGEGTLGKFLQEEGAYEEIMAFIADARETLAEATSGEGSLARFIQDPKLYGDLEETVDRLNVMTADAQAGKGTVGRLLNDEELYENVNGFFGKASDLVDDVVEGDGLLAALIGDEHLADEFKAILSQALGAIEDARETTPVTSLGSFIFGTF